MNSKFANRLYNFAVNNNQREVALQSFQELSETRREDERINGLFQDHYVTTFQRPRQEQEEQYRVFVAERETVFKEFLRTRNVATLQTLVSMKPPPMDKDNTIFTRYANPMLL